MSPLQELQQAVREGRYELTVHAWQEAGADDLHALDVESAVLTGAIVRIEADPNRGTKYVVKGTATIS